MMTRHRGRLGAMTGVAFAALLALPAAAFANTSAPIAQTGGMTATLPLLGSPLTVAVTLDTVGNVSAVNLDPIGTYSATSLDAHAVTFENGDGTAQVKIKAKGDRLSIAAAAGTLADLLGSGTWSADVFGTGAKSTVNYTIGDAGGGVPSVTIDAVNAAAGITTTTQPMKSSDEDGEHMASVSVDFAMNGFVKRLTISVGVDDEGDHQAHLKITLTGKDRQKLMGALAELAGAHGWSGALCDGTVVGATFTVAPDGTITYAGATGAPASARTLGHGVLVRFDGTKVSVLARLLPQGGDQWRLAIQGKTGRCGHQSGPAPTVNTPVSLKDGQTGDSSWDGHDGGSGDSGGSWGGH